MEQLKLVFGKPVTEIIVGSHLTNHEINSLLIKQSKIHCSVHKRLGKQIG